jgi:uncharacterized membrane protein YgaE (UPF0421/DUF939 family)
MGLLSPIQAQREVTRETWAESCVYAGQAVVATVVVLAVYRWVGKPGGMWAAVSAVLVLQPGFRRSLASSAIRVIANLLGAGIGVAVALSVPDRTVAVCIALTLIIFACEILKLDAGVRSACASVLIVSIGSEPIAERGIERSSAVAIGCGMALLLQLIMQPIIQQFRRGVASPDGARDGAMAE